jgi:hypothetical protein
MEGYEFWAIGIGREELPRPTMCNNSDRPAATTGHRRINGSFPILPGREGTVTVQADGTFRITTPIAADGQPGIYYVFIWAIKQGAKKVPQNSFMVSSRTITVAASETADEE